MIAAIIGLSIVSIIVIIVASAVGVRDVSSGLWPVIYIFPDIGLPIGFVLIIVLLIISARRRSREAREEAAAAELAARPAPKRTQPKKYKNKK
jgi:uncharacterized membrane protein